MRKRRPRSHQIADLSVNHVEGFILRCNFTVQRIEKDYGIDLFMTTFNDRKEVEPGLVLMQLKATETIEILTDQRTISFAVSSADLNVWLNELMPVILVVYDVTADRAYWLYVQAYFRKIPGFSLDQQGDTIRVHLDITRTIDEGAIRLFARFKNRILRENQGKIHHDDQNDSIS